MSASPIFLLDASLNNTSQSKPLDRTPGLLRSLSVLRYKGNTLGRDYSDEPPLNWTSHSHGIQLEGPALGKLAYFRSLSLVDETEIPGPAVPVGRNQLVHSYLRLGCQPLSECVSHEHDDRQASRPAYTEETNTYDGGLSRVSLSRKKVVHMVLKWTVCRNTFGNPPVLDQPAVFCVTDFKHLTIQIEP